MRTGIFFFAAAMLLVLSAPAVYSSISIQDNNSVASEAFMAFNYPTLFESNGLLELSIRFEHKKVIKDVGDDRKYHDALVFFTGQDSISDSINVRIRTRGHFRRDPMNCDFPPLLLNFKKTDTENTIFEGLDKVKLVLPCKAGREAYEQYVLKEYLVYRMYNLLTEESFRVRLVRINFIDETGRKDPLLKYGFLIEPKEYLGLRNDSEVINVKNISQNATNQDRMLSLCIFQYMIGNTDWSVPVLHNIVLLRREPWTAPVAIPFDFDWCGLVFTPYAIPHPSLGLETVRDRMYRGYCRPEEEFLKFFKLFQDKKAEIYDLCVNFSYLDEKHRKQLISYIDSFYKILDNPRSIKNEFYIKCR